MTRALDAGIAVPAQCELAEGPFWDAARGRLRWVDILRGQVHALDPATGAHTWFGTGGELGTAGHAGDIFVCTPGVTGRPPYLFGA